MSNSAFQPTVLTVPASGSSTGQGELNLVTNPSAVGSSTTGWLATSATLGTGSSGGPLNPTVGTYFTIINTVGSPTESSTSGAYSVLTLPSGMQNRKLKVEFYFTSPATDTFKVSVYKSSTRVPLSTDSAGSTSLPQSTTGKFTAYFDTDSSGTWTVSITKTAGGGSTPLQFTNVVVGPGIQPQGAVVGSDVLWTNPTTAGFGTLVSPNLYYQRVGTKLKIQGYWTNGTVAASLATLTLPSNLTIDGSLIPSGATQVVGYWQHSNSSATTPKRGTILASGTGTTVRFGIDDYTNSQSPLTQQNASAITGTGLAFEVNFEVPIAEWAGSGTVQLAQNDVEYAYNTSTATTGNDTTSFGYGPSGTSFVALTAAVRRRVRFQTPIQTGDRLAIEVQATSTSPWIELVGYDTNGLQRLSFQNGVSYGLGLDPTYINATDVDVFLGTYGYASSTYGAVGTAWSSYTAYRWRVRKSSAGAAVGFGIHQPGVSSGLVSASGLVGRTDGLAVPTGYVGEIIKNNSAVATTYAGSAIWYDATSFNLTAGIWLITTQLRYERNGATMAGEFLSGISTTSGNSSTGLVAGDNLLSNDNGSGTVNRGAITISSYPVNVTSTTTYYFKTRADFSAGSPNYIWSYRAVRIA